MSKSKTIMAFAILSLITVGNLVAQSANATDDHGNNPNDGGGPTPSLRPNTPQKSSIVINQAPSNGTYKLDHSGSIYSFPNCRVRICRLRQFQ